MVCCSNLVPDSISLCCFSNQLVVEVGFMLELISIGKWMQQQNLVERSCTEAAFDQKTQNLGREKSSAEIFYLGRKKESKKRD
ncbi:hypothetical protein V6N11_021859 [Hibiscus sabdariffa]|uniref:Uncharacterized protein n=1 Tax=Hibiscus sabdariffa TaxID=183260 RepID=A0ABR2THX3_9ROSI